MPELPEVETVCRGLEKTITRKTIDSVETHRANLRIPFPKNLKDASGRRIDAITRRAKYIILSLSGGISMIIHLGMSGRMLIRGKNDNKTIGKHDHMVIVLRGGTDVVFNDPRRFGLVDIVETKKLSAHRFFAHLGPEPFDTGFTAGFLQKALDGKRPAIKVAIMDQRLIVGVGNIYACEALYMSGIDPRRNAGDITPPELKKLVTAIRKVLEKAIEAGGSSLRDYVQTDGELGYFQHSFRVYGREGTACRKCGTEIARITQAGRSTFYCPTCQK